MNNHTLSHNCAQNQQNTRFRSVRYKGIDYLSEASARRRLMMNVLELPVPFQLASNIYAHTGRLQDIAYRVPWSQCGNKISTSKLPVTGSVMDDLKENTCFGDCLERFNVFQVQAGSGQEEVVPSSNPTSQSSIGYTEALSDLNDIGSSEIRSPWNESFSPCTLDAFCFSCDDLTLPEDVIFADHLRFKSHLPSFHTMLQRLKIMTVSDPLLNSSVMLPDDVVFRHLASYTAGIDRVTVPTVTGGNATEVFIKEAVLNEESLMLPVHMECLGRPEANFSSAKLQDFLNLISESMDEKKSFTDLHREVTDSLSDKHKTELEVLQIEESSCTYDSLKEPKSPVALKLYTEMELDLPLSPCNETLCPPDLFLFSRQHSAEQLSPVYKQCFMSDSECENMEKDVWMAEKYPQCVAGFLLAEPKIDTPLAPVQSLSDILMLLRVKREHVESKENVGQSHLTNSTEMIPKNFGDLAIYTENIQATDIEGHKNEEFSPLSIVNIDKLLVTFAVNADQPTGVHPAQSNHLQTAVPAPVDEEIIAKVCRTEAMSCQADRFTAKTTRETDSKAEQIEQHTSNTTSFKRTTPERCSESQRNHSEITCPLEEHLNFSKEVEMSKSSPLKRKDTEAMSTVHKLPEMFNQRGEETICKSSQLLYSSRGKLVKGLVAKSHKSQDPLSSFMMLRTVQKSPDQTPQQNSSTSAGQSPKGKASEPVLKVNGINRLSDTGDSVTVTETSKERPFSQTIYVQATESQRNAYRELNVLALPCLSKAHELGLTALNNRDFGTMSPDLTRFLLKQQEKTLRTQQGGEGVFNEVKLMHVLVTLKELLLKCDLHTAADYLAQAKASCALNCLDELLRKFEVLQYLAQKWQELDPKLLELQEQIHTWMNSHTNHNTRVLVLTVNSVTTELLAALEASSQVSGNSVSALVPEEGKSTIMSREVMDSLSCSRCVVLCSQHVGPDFPWQSFSLVLELQCVGHSPFSSVCSERNIKYISFSTAVPNFSEDCNTVSYLDSIPFVLIVTDGLLKRWKVQHALETTYDMILLERKHSPCAQKLGGAHYDVITVDENTAVLIQELSELEMDRASNRVVMRLSSLSLQYSHCWLILHCAESCRALIPSSIYINLVLIYSSLVLFGHKSEKFYVKVLLVYEEEEIARCIFQIALHTLMNSERDGLSWLDRDWLSVQPTEAEDCLLQFPCINPLVAQLMLRRAPSLLWLLGASLVELQEMFPQVPHKVIKLFSDITAEHKLKTAASESENEASSQKNSSAHLPYLPPKAQMEAQACNSQHYSGHQEDKTPAGQFKELIAGLRQQDQTHWTPAENTVCGFRQQDQTHWTPPENTVCGFRQQDQTHWTPPENSVCGFRQQDQTHWTPPENSVCGFRQQDQTHWTPPESSAAQKTEERKRQRAEDLHAVSPQCKRGKLLCERVPGRNDGQTRLRFF